MAKCRRYIAMKVDPVLVVSAALHSMFIDTAITFLTT